MAGEAHNHQEVKRPNTPPPPDKLESSEGCIESTVFCYSQRRKTSTTMSNGSNGNSYQKNGGVGVYNEIPSMGGPEGGKKKTIIGAAVVVVLGIISYLSFGSKHDGSSVAKVMEKAQLNIASDGKLKLFDNMSELDILFDFSRIFLGSENS